MALEYGDKPRAGVHAAPLPRAVRGATLSGAAISSSDESVEWRLALVSEAEWAAREAALDHSVASWLAQLGFRGLHGQVALVAGDGERGPAAFIGLGNAAADDPLTYSFVPRCLPNRRFIAPDLPEGEREAFALGWALGSYRFARYRADTAAPARLIQPRQLAPIANAVISAEIDARDWINSTASDLGPEQLVQLVVNELEPLGATTRSVSGEALGVQGFRYVWAAGQGSARTPAIVEAVWGDPAAPKVTLVGKGVCFDSGGINAKHPAEARTMKADMAGAAHVLALARLLIAARSPIRLRVIVAAIDNMPSGVAMRNGDVVIARNGRSIEIGHSDHEGRLILADALAWAAEDSPDLLIDIATLTDTGLGPDIAGFFTPDDALAHALAETGAAVHDPVWRLPLWQRYRSQIESGVADLSNIGSSQSTIAAIAGALFLQDFVQGAASWLHFDIEAWNGIEGGDRPAGGNVVGLRALFRMLVDRYGAGDGHAEASVARRWL